MFALEVNGLQKSYHANTVLKGFSLTVESGSFFGFAGVNGAGKSTFLKCMLNFCHYELGKIEIFGVDAKNALARSDIAFLPERFVPPYYLTGREFIQLMLKLQGSQYDESLVKSMLDDLDLEHVALAKSVRSYSKGMTQKLGLATCFLARKKMYVLDEPMSGLDPKARALAKRLFNRLKAQGITLFFTSHALADIDEVCDQVAILHNGLIHYTGPPQELLKQYENTKTLEEAYLRCINAGLEI